MNIPILFEDPFFLVVDKPAGISVLPEGWNKDIPYLKKILEEKYKSLWTVHRIDKTTSGVLLFARDAKVHKHLNTLFEHHQVSKIYHAILVGIPAWSKMRATQPLKPNTGHSHRTMVDFINGKQTATNFRVLQTTDGYTLVEASLETGRTHQIRAHSAANGFPILADKLYGASQTEIISRPALHALNLEFVHPVHGHLCQFTAPYPSDFRMAMEQLKLVI